MKQHMVTTNVRMPETGWLQVKAAAGELGMSINEYFNHLANMHIIRKTVGFSDMPDKSRKRFSIWDLPKLARKTNKPMGWSKEDEIIYGT